MRAYPPRITASVAALQSYLLKKIVTKPLGAPHETPAKKACMVEEAQGTSSNRTNATGATCSHTPAFICVGVWRNNPTQSHPLQTKRTQRILSKSQNDLPQPRQFVNGHQKQSKTLNKTLRACLHLILRPQRNEHKEGHFNNGMTAQ